MLVNIIEKMREKPYLLEMGAGKLAKYFNTTKDVIYTAKRKVRESLTHIPKILILDIETSPLKAYVWSRWKQNIYLDQTISEWFCISWSAKWLYSPITMSGVLTPIEIKNEDDGRIITELWHIINNADIVIAHNGDKFDIPKINSRFILNDLPPTKPFRTIDTKLVAAKQFGFSSNKLDALATYFGIPNKDETDFELWVKCMDGDEEALKYMETYNKHDVEILEEVYLRLRPWIKNHPNVGNYIDSDVPMCSHCGNTKLIKLEDDYYYTQVGKYEIFRCTCGAISRGRVNLLNKKLKMTTTNNPINKF